MKRPDSQQYSEALALYFSEQWGTYLESQQNVGSLIYHDNILECTIIAPLP